MNRNLLAVIVLVTCAATTAIANATEIEGPAVRWNVSLWGQKRTFTAGFEKLAELVRARTGGSFTMTLHYGGALSKSRENLDGIAVDAFEAAMICNFYHPLKNPALMVLTLPFLPMANWQNNRKVRDAVYAHPAIISEFTQWNAMLYMSSYLPQYEFMGKGNPPSRLEDWTGKTVRAGGGIGKAMRILGATPTSSTATEVYTGVQQGTMDAAAFPLATFVDYNIHEIADWFTANLSPGTSDCPLVFSKRAFDRLPDQYKKLLMDVKDEAAAAQIQAYANDGGTVVKMLEGRLTKITYSEEQVEAFRLTAGKPVIDRWIADNQGKFDARGLVELVYSSVGQQYD